VLNIARSRNDIDMTVYRMHQRGLLLELSAALLELRAALVELAGQHRETVYAAHTHTQPAQPTTLAHFLLAIGEQLARDDGRLRAAYRTTNRSPLGACAITGTGFPIDRGRTSQLLGFDEPTGNTYDSIATVDYVLESVSAIIVLLVGLGRVLHDLLLWCTAEFGYLRLGDGFVQGSTIMPQKRNPVALEHARAIASTGVGRGSAIVATVHNTPYGDIVDTEDDLQPLIDSTFRDAIRAVRLVAGALAGATFDVERMRARAADAGTTMTELADTLVREHRVSASTGRRIAQAFATLREARPERPAGETLAAASLEQVGAALALPEERLADVLSARHFVAVRRTWGGPAPDETRRAVSEAATVLERDSASLAERRARLVAASSLLDEAIARLS
jgi:argininosuccinate lyase